MNTIIDKYIEGDVSLNEVVSYFSLNSNVNDLLNFTKKKTYRATALYILSEIPRSQCRPVWRYVLRYLGDRDEQVVFYALDIFHNFLQEARPAELMLALQVAELNSQIIFKKLFVITLSATNSLLEGVCKLAREQRLPAQHLCGLTLLLNDTASEREVAEAVQGDDLVKRFYGCCAVGRNHRENPRLLTLLPKPIQQRLAIYQVGHSRN